MHLTHVHMQGFGEPRDYCRRQLRRWTTQYEGSSPTPMQEVRALVQWLNANVPPEDGQQGRWDTESACV
jgi:aminoglycoside phosphotransferase (APT) family kinase protein